MKLLAAFAFACGLLGAAPPGWGQAPRTNPCVAECQTRSQPGLQHCATIRDVAARHACVDQLNAHYEKCAGACMLGTGRPDICGPPCARRFVTERQRCGGLPAGPKRDCMREVDAMEQGCVDECYRNNRAPGK